MTKADEPITLDAVQTAIYGPHLYYNHVNLWELSRRAGIPYETALTTAWAFVQAGLLTYNQYHNRFQATDARPANIPSMGEVNAWYIHTSRRKGQPA